MPPGLDYGVVIDELLRLTALRVCALPRARQLMALAAAWSWDSRWAWRAARGGGGGEGALRGLEEDVLRHVARLIAGAAPMDATLVQRITKQQRRAW